MSEELFIEGLKRRDPRIQASFFKKWYRYLFVVAYDITRNEMDAEDVLQESFLKIFDRIHMFTPGNSLKAWMSVTVKRTAINHYNRNKKYQGFEIIEGFEPMQKKAANFIDGYMAGDTFKIALRALHKKSGNQYMYARLHLEEGMTQTEISKDIDVPVGTVKSQVSRALASLRTYINEFENRSIISL